MQNIVLFIHGISGVFFILLVLMQDKGVGFGTAIGGAGGAVFHSTKRGAEKVLNYLSVFFVLVFMISALLYVVTPPSDPSASPEQPSVELSDVSSEPVNISSEPVVVTDSESVIDQ